jgi:hypothetical protein
LLRVNFCVHQYQSLREWLPPCLHVRQVTLGPKLYEAVTRNDIAAVKNVLAAPGVNRNYKNEVRPALSSFPASHSAPSPPLPFSS